MEAWKDGHAAASGTAARADDASDIRALFYKVSRAMSAKDAGAIMAVSTRDLTYIEKGKILSGDQVYRHMQQRFRRMHGTPRARFTVLSMQVKGKSASVMTSDYTEAEVQGGTRDHKVVANGRSRNELVRTKQGWLLKSIFVLSSSTTMDGKNLNISALGTGAR